MKTENCHNPSKNDFLKTGPPLIGIILNWWFFGILLMQYFIYFRYQKHSDHKYLHCVVYCLLALDTVQTVMTMIDAFRWFVYNYGDYGTFFETSTASISSPFMDGLIALIVQLVYSWRIRELSNWTVFPCFIGLLSLIGGVNGMVVGVYGGVVRTVPRWEQGFYPATLLWLWSGVVADVLIAVSMLYLLVKLKNHATSKTVLRSVQRGIILTLETNLLTTAAAVATAVMLVVKSLAPPSTNLYLIGGYILGKLYSNCFMVNLNQRTYYLVPSEGNNPGLTELISIEKRGIIRHKPSTTSATVDFSMPTLVDQKIVDLESGNLSTRLCEIHGSSSP